MNKVMLVVLDGWGLGQVPEADAIHQARTPFVDQLMNSQPWSTLVTHGESVGLPRGQFGNSEVGHIHLGAGRTVYQDLGLIDHAIQSGSLAQNAVLEDLVQYCQVNQKPVHLIGLVSDGGVHSHIQHLMGLIEILENKGVERIFVHAILDGRDTDPHAGRHYLRQLGDFLNGRKSRLVSIIGRYYAMDRDKRWERTAEAYALYTRGEGLLSQDLVSSLEQSYRDGVTDEFVKATLLEAAFSGKQFIQANDAVLCFNFRTDRLRQLTEVLTQKSHTEQNMAPLPLQYVTMTRYDETYRGVKVIFEKQDLKETLGEMVSRYGGTQLRIAETEKYPHVSFFFSGGREAVFAGEKRILIPSPKVATYDLQPEMSADAVTLALIREIEENAPDFICVNYANTDMVGHTGVFDAVIKAAETVDHCLSSMIPVALKSEYRIIVLADHGNGELMVNPDGTPHTAHTMNPVPCILIGDQTGLKIKNGGLADIAPTLLELMGLPVPASMTGQSLLVHGENKDR